MAGANGETVTGLEAAKESMRLQKQIDDEKEKYAKKILDAQRKEGEAHEQLAISRMTTEEKREYLIQKRASFEEQAREADLRGEKEKAASLRAEAYSLQQGLYTRGCSVA